LQLSTDECALDNVFVHGLMMTSTASHAALRLHTVAVQQTQHHH